MDLRTGAYPNLAIEARHRGPLVSSMLQLDAASKSMPHSTSARNPSQKKNFTISSPAPPDAFSNCLFAWTDLGESRANSNRKAPHPPSEYTTILKRPVQSILVLLHSPQTPPFPFSPPLRSESGSVSAYVQHPPIWGEKRRLNHSLLWCDSRPRIVINLSPIAVLRADSLSSSSVATERGAP